MKILSKFPSAPIAAIAIALGCWSVVSLARGMSTLIAFWKIMQPIGEAKYLVFDVVPLLSSGLLWALTAGVAWGVFLAVKTAQRQQNED